MANTHSWVELFKIHCRAFDVLDHIIPAAATPSSSKTDDVTASTAATAARAQWNRLDAIVLQRIYAAAAWTALEHIFVDSKPTRAIHLKLQFANAKLANFPNMNAYCQEVKNIADQLANVDAPVDNDALILQLIVGLSDQFDGIATILQQTAPLPDFYTTRSKLCMEESRKTSQSSPAALHTSASPTPSHQLTHPLAATQGVPHSSFAPLAVANQSIHRVIEAAVTVAAVVAVAADVTPTHLLLMATTHTIIPYERPHTHTLLTHLLAPHPYPPSHQQPGASLVLLPITPTPLPNTPTLLTTLNKPCTP